VTAIAKTDLACTEDNRRSLQTIVREVIPTDCIDRVAACDSRGKVVVTASCPSKASAEKFSERAGQWGRTLKHASQR
jgi:hypothetical protein